MLLQDVGIMFFYLVLREYEIIVKEALQELCVGSRCKLESAEVLPECSGWSILLTCDGSALTISGLEGVLDPQSRKEMKNRIKAAICQRLDLGGPLRIPERMYTVPACYELSVLF
ncbi:MAG: hypothetical protein QOH96_819 [Blastocatellia bacterium]|jgi:hypothetical protein|nr:hypothetical protein [Blastocatellia bacterium]